MFDGTVPQGTGEGVHLAMEKASLVHVYVFNGDTFLDLETEHAEDQWQCDQRPLIVGSEMLDTARYGRLLADGRMVTGFTEKGIIGNRLINTGYYVLNRGLLDTFPVSKSFSLETDFLDFAVPQGRFDEFVTDGKFIDIGVPEDYFCAQLELAEFIQ